MIDGTANLLGAVGLAVADRIEKAAREVMQRAGETPAALIVIGYGLGPSNDQLRRVLDLSHPGTVRLVDRLVADGLVERRSGEDRRAIALHLTSRGKVKRDALLSHRLAEIKPLLDPLSASQQTALDGALRSILASIGVKDEERRRICRMCDDRVCEDCPIPADFKRGAESA